MVRASLLFCHLFLSKSIIHICTSKHFLFSCSNNVYGRQKIGVKICSCPKRDKEKEEEYFSDPNGKRKTKVKKDEKHSRLEPPAKKIKQEFSASDANPRCTFMVCSELTSAYYKVVVLN